MDIRIHKTRTSIYNAFFTLREKKELEKITIKELTEIAKISKQTFYLHYKDIYDLSEQIEKSLLMSLWNPSPIRAIFWRILKKPP